MIKLNLQYFGTGGQKSKFVGANIKKKKNDNIVSFPSSGNEPVNEAQTRRVTWDSREYVQEVDKLVEAVDRRWGLHSQRNLAVALVREQERISRAISEVESGIEDGDVNVLLTQMRRVRQAQKKLKEKMGY